MVWHLQVKVRERSDVLVLGSQALMVLNLTWVAMGKVKILLMKFAI
jgi:hypothetical protein